MLKRSFVVFFSMIYLLTCISSSYIYAYEKNNKNKIDDEIIECNNKYLVTKDIDDAIDIKNLDVLKKKEMANKEEDINRKLLSVNSGEYYVCFGICKHDDLSLIINYYLRQAMKKIRVYFKGYRASFPIVVTNYNYNLNCDTANIWNEDYDILNKSYEYKYLPLIIDRFPKYYLDQDYLKYIVHKIICSEFKINAIKNNKDYKEFEWFAEAFTDLVVVPECEYDNDFYCEVNPKLMLKYKEECAEECIGINRLILENWFATTIIINGNKFKHYDLLLKKNYTYSLREIFLAFQGKEAVIEAAKYLEKIKSMHIKELYKRQEKVSGLGISRRLYKRDALKRSENIDKSIEKLNEDLEYLKKFNCLL